MVLRNFVVLENDVPAVMHFADHEFVDRDITDPLTRRPKQIRVLEFVVDRLGGQEVETLFSVTSEKLAQTLEPFLPGKRYQQSTFVITKRGSGFRTEYEVQTLPA